MSLFSHINAIKEAVNKKTDESFSTPYTPRNWDLKGVKFSSAQDLADQAMKNEDLYWHISGWGEVDEEDTLTSIDGFKIKAKEVMSILDSKPNPYSDKNESISKMPKYSTMLNKKYEEYLKKAGDKPMKFTTWVEEYEKDKKNESVNEGKTYRWKGATFTRKELEQEIKHNMSNLSRYRVDKLEPADVDFYKNNIISLRRALDPTQDYEVKEKEAKFVCYSTPKKATKSTSKVNKDGSDDHYKDMTTSKDIMQSGKTFGPSKMKESLNETVKIGTKLIFKDNEWFYDGIYTVLEEPTSDNNHFYILNNEENGETSITPKDIVDFTKDKTLTIQESTINERKWDYNVDFNFLKDFDEEVDNFSEIKNKAIETLNKLIAEIKTNPKSRPEEAEEITKNLGKMVDEFKAASDEVDFDYALRQLYDLGDDYSIWFGGIKESKDESKSAGHYASLFESNSLHEKQIGPAKPGKYSKLIDDVPFDISAIGKVYIGKPGCMCGCRGKYYYADITKAENWQLDDKNQEGNTRRVNRVYNLVKANATKGIEVIDDYIYTVMIGSTQYTIYLNVEPPAIKAFKNKIKKESVLKESDDRPIEVADNIMKDKHGDYIVGWVILNHEDKKITKVKGFKDKLAAQEFQTELKSFLKEAKVNENENYYGLSDEIKRLKIQGVVEYFEIDGGYCLIFETEEEANKAKEIFHKDSNIQRNFDTKFTNIRQEPEGDWGLDLYFPEKKNESSDKKVDKVLGKLDKDSTDFKDESKTNESNLNESTHCIIAIENLDGTSEAIYCHYDGYEAAVGKTLRKYYTDEAKVRQLMVLGDISSLGKEIGTKHAFNGDAGNQTTAYGRDRNEKGTAARKYKNIKLMDRGESEKESAYCYIYNVKNKKWESESFNEAKGSTIGTSKQIIGRVLVAAGIFKEDYTYELTSLEPRTKEIGQRMVNALNKSGKFKGKWSLDNGLVTPGEEDLGESITEAKVNEMALIGTNYVVRAQAHDRKTNKPIGTPRDENINIKKNVIFKNVKSIGEIEAAYEAFWNNLDPNSAEVIKVIAIKPLGEAKSVNEGAFGYVPYAGGAGPEEALVKGNNQALIKGLKAKGIEANLMTVDIDGPVEIVVVNVNGKNRSAGYDRWGFVSDDGDGTLDQAQIEDTINYLATGKLPESKISEDGVGAPGGNEDNEEDDSLDISESVLKYSTIFSGSRSVNEDTRQAQIKIILNNLINKLKKEADIARKDPDTKDDREYLNMLDDDINDIIMIENWFMVGNRKLVNKKIDNLDTAVRDLLPVKLLTWAKSEWSNEPYESKLQENYDYSGMSDEELMQNYSETLEGAKRQSSDKDVEYYDNAIGAMRTEILKRNIKTPAIEEAIKVPLTNELVVEVATALYDSNGDNQVRISDIVRAVMTKANSKEDDYIKVSEFVRSALLAKGWKLDKMGPAVSESKEEKICPSCNKPYIGPSALSRKDNKTEICPACGTAEAMYQHYTSGPMESKVNEVTEWKKDDHVKFQKEGNWVVGTVISVNDNVLSVAPLDGSAPVNLHVSNAFIAKPSDAGLKERLTQKVKVGDKVIFKYFEADFDNSAENRAAKDHNGQEATVTGIQVEYDTPEEPYYIDIKFKDGLKIKGCDAEHLKLIKESKVTEDAKIVKTKISDWLEDNVGSHNIYAEPELSQKFEQATGQKANWPKHTVGGANATVGQLKGTIKEIPGPESAHVSYGFEIAAYLEKEFAKSDTYSNYSGRGSAFRASVAALKGKGL